MKKRLFFAFPIPSEIKKILMEGQAQDPEIHWTSVENLHITVFFCGDIEETDILEMNKKIVQAAQNMASFKLIWQGIVFGPPRGPARMIWAQYQQNPQFTGLVETIYVTVKNFLQPENNREPSFQQIPHMTLARFKNPGVAKKFELQKYTFGPLSVDYFQLMSSQLTSQGPIYTTLYTYKLSKSA